MPRPRSLSRNAQMSMKPSTMRRIPRTSSPLPLSDSRSKTMRRNAGISFNVFCLHSGGLHQEAEGSLPAL